MPRSVVVAAVLLAACGDPAPTPEPAGTTSETAPRPPAREDAEAAQTVRPGVPLDRLLASRDDDAPVLAALRTPREVRVEAEPNRYVEGQVDTVRTYVYDGMTIEAYEVAGGRTFVQEITITGGDYGTASGLSVDALRSDVEAALGAPVRETGTEAVYETGGGATPTVVTVVYEPDEQGRPRATRITWAPYVD